MNTPPTDKSRPAIVRCELYTDAGMPRVAVRYDDHGEEDRPATALEEHLLASRSAERSQVAFRTADLQRKEPKIVYDGREVETPSSDLPANDRALALLQRQKKAQHYDVDEWVDLVREVERNCAAWHQATMTAGTLLGLPGGLGAVEFTAAVQQRERQIREVHTRLLAEAKAEVAAESATSPTKAIPAELFDGAAVYVEATKIGNELQPKHVSTVLDAVVRLIRKNQRATDRGNANG